MLFNDDCLNTLPSLKQNSIDLTIADPPYFKTIGEKWDYQWRTEDEYISWSLLWLTELHRVMRYGGTLYLFGYFRTLSKLVSPLEDIGFSLRQDIILSKGIRAVSGRATKGYKQFPTTTEHCLFLIKDSKPYIREVLKEKQVKLGITAKEINRRLGVKENGGGMWSIFTGNNVCEQVPTKEMWNKLQEILQFQIDYNTIAQTFNPEMGITDVWELDFYVKPRSHPTQKPKALIERLIKCSSNSGDVILDPFFGSGISILTSIQLNRDYVGCELDSIYYKKLKDKL